jgi:spermidine/putrescine transport system substrate-binding protein
MKFFVRTLYVILITFILFGVTYFSSYTTSKIRKKNILNIFVWGDFFPEEVLENFEKETGIKLNVNFYTCNEELILKLESSDGVGYDIVFPSDYGVTTLRQKGLLKPLDKSKFDFMDKIEPYLLNRPFDPNNDFTIPYFWEVYGMAYEKSKIDSTYKASLKDLFEGDQKVIMTADPVEAVDFASHYLFGYKKYLTSDEKKSVIDLLKKQKKHVEAYTDDRVQYMISSENCPLAILRVSFFWKNYEDLSHLKLLLPKEGIFTSIENVALSKNAEHLDAAYQFINYIYKPEIMAKQLDLSPLFPACQETLLHTNLMELERYPELFKEIQRRNDFFFTHYVIPQESIREAWVEIKS